MRSVTTPSSSAPGIGSVRARPPVASARPRQAEVAPVGEPHAPAGAVDRLHPHAGDELDVALGEQIAPAQHQAVLGGLAGEQRLRQRRPLIGRMRLVADHHQRAVIALGAQRFGDLQPRLRGADDDDGVGHCRKIRDVG